MINERKVVEIATLNNLLNSGGAKFLQGLQSNGSISVDAGASGNAGEIHLGNAAHKFAMHVSAGNTVGLYDQTYGKWMLSCDSSGNVVLNGTADTANQVYSTVVNGTPSQAYSAIPFTQTSLTATGAKALSHSSNAFGFMASSTAAGTEGYAILVLGNNIAQATANNKRARLRLYGNTTYYHDIYAGTSAQTGNISLTLPNGASGGWLVGAASAGVGGSAAPVYVNSSGVVTACKVNGYGSWHNNGLAVQTGAVLEIGQYIDFHNSTSTNDYDVRLNAGTTRNSLNVVYPVAPTAAGILRNIQISVADLTAGKSPLTNGYVYLVYE